MFMTKADSVHCWQLSTNIAFLLHGRQ